MWEISQNSRVLFGCKKIREIAGILKWYKLKRIFIVTYSSEIPALEAIKLDLQANGIDYYVFDQVKGEPDLYIIEKGKLALISEKCDGVLAIGGGSVIDSAKAIAMLVSNGGSIEEYQMDGKPIVEDTPLLIAVPTTSGTGSEATRVSVIYNNNNQLKKSVYSPCMIPDIVVLDPELTISLPADKTASTGIDSLSHAIESYVSLNANTYTELFSIKAIGLIARSLESAVMNGKNIQARSDMMLAAYMAGCALTAGIGLAHIVAQPIGGIFKIPHGEACSIYLPLSMEINLEYSIKKYRKIGEELGCCNTLLDDTEAGEMAIAKVRELIDNIGTAKRLSQYVNPDSIDLENILGKISQATGHIKCNPKPIDKGVLTDIIMKSL